MTRQARWALALLSVVAALALTVFGWRDDASSPDVEPAQALQAGTVSAQPGDAPGRRSADTTAEISSAPQPADTSEAPSPLDSMTLPSFHADARGHLRRDAHTRIGVERIAALFEPAEALDTLARQSAALPPVAQGELIDLYHRYVRYGQAVATTMPQGQQAQPAAEVWSQFEALKQLRRQHFGDEAAQAMFGDEERQAAQWMRQQGPAAAR